MTRNREGALRAVGVAPGKGDVVTATNGDKPEPLEGANNPIERCIDRELHGSTETAVSATKASITGESF